MNVVEFATIKYGSLVPCTGDVGPVVGTLGQIATSTGCVPDMILRPCHY